MLRKFIPIAMTLVMLFSSVCSDARAVGGKDRYVVNIVSDTTQDVYPFVIISYEGNGDDSYNVDIDIDSFYSPEGNIVVLLKLLSRGNVRF